MAAGLTERLLDELRDCSGGRAECVVYLTADQSDLHSIDGMVHASHTSGDAHYTVDSAWLNGLFIDLVDDRRSIVAQVHTHPTEWVGHSWIDDAFPVVPMPGLLSVVVPWHAVAAEPVAFGVHRLEPDGSWSDAGEAITW